MPSKVQSVSRTGRMSKQQKELLINRLEVDRFLLHQEKLNPAELKKYNLLGQVVHRSKWTSRGKENSDSMERGKLRGIKNCNSFNCNLGTKRIKS
jgi:hypothetical protein